MLQGESAYNKSAISEDYADERDKTILDCSPEKEGFYVKCQYEKAGSEMHHYYDAKAEEYGV